MRQRELAVLLLNKASEDELLLKKIINDQDIADSIIGFHAQQAAEKLIKALLASKSVRFRKTHDLRVLMDLVEETGLSFPESLVKLDLLTPYAT